MARILLYAFNAILLYYAVVLFARQWYALRAMFSALSDECIGEACRADIPVLQQRATRAPVNTKSKILAIAIAHSNAIVRHRAISISRHANIATFPQTFVHNLHKESDENNKLWGLRVSSQLLGSEQLRKVYTVDRLQLLINKIDHQLRRGGSRKHTESVKNRLAELRNQAVSFKIGPDPGAA